MKNPKTPTQRPRKAPSNQTGGTAWGKKLAAEFSRMVQSADMKKLILLNFPYIIAFYMVEKAAWLYRHCNGDSVVDRLMVLFMNFGLAYKSVLPSFHTFDLMVGLVGAAALKAVIYFKGKNAKKYRQGEEYGSARWLIGMNGTRAFTKKYGRKQTIGRVQTPTLAMLAERQAKIQNFVKEPYYKVELSGAGVVAVSEQMVQEQDADTVQAACDGQCAVVGSIERKRVEKKPPKPYDLTTLQREANRYYGLTASQTLQALQELYEEKLVTYPRTDSQFVTEDMRKTVESLVLALDGTAADVSCVINNSKVTDHHAILPTMQSVKCSKEKLSETKQKILSLIIWKLVQAVQPPFIYEDVFVTVCCQGRNFTAKYKDVLQPGYIAKPVPFVEPEKNKDVPFPKKMEQGMVLPVVRAEKKQDFTSPPKVYTEDTLLSAMETAGNKEFEKDTEKKGLGTPATRAAILEKLVSTGYVQRKGKQMIPTEDGVAAIRNIPDYLKSASMTAEWENDLLRMERGEIKPYDFMQGIHGLLDKMLADLRQIPTVASAPHHNKVSVGSCPVCGNPVHESKLSFCCADRSCKFALWKESRYLANMRKTLDKKMAVDLLKKGRTHVKDFYSVKKDKTFAADLVMRVEDDRAQYSLEFPKAPMKKKT